MYSAGKYVKSAEKNTRSRVLRWLSVSPSLSGVRFWMAANTANGLATIPSTVVIPVLSEMRLMCLRYTESVLGDFGVPLAVVLWNVFGKVNGMSTNDTDLFLSHYSLHAP